MVVAQFIPYLQMAVRTTLVTRELYFVKKFEPIIKLMLQSGHCEAPNFMYVQRHFLRGTNLSETRHALGFTLRTCLKVAKIGHKLVYFEHVHG